MIPPLPPAAVFDAVDQFDLGVNLDDELMGWSLEELAWQPGELVRSATRGHAQPPRPRLHTRSAPRAPSSGVNVVTR